MTRREKYVLAALLAITAFLLLLRLGRADMLGDDAHYAFRALGYFDYLASENQTTPVQWFDFRPWWSLLSFHDHPPLFFFIQHLFFSLFGWSVAVARLTSVFAALGASLVLFFWGRKIANSSAAGLLAVAFTALNSYFIWMGRVGLLEALMTFFLLVALYWLHEGLESDSKFLIWAGLGFGLAFLSKYTMLFALPGTLVYLLLAKRSIFKTRRFWLGALVFLIVITPVIVYNLQLYQTRGHFDVQFSDLLGHNNQDRPNLTDRVSGFRFEPAGVIRVLASGFSWPYLIALAVALGLGAYFAERDKQKAFYLPLLVFASMFLFFSLIGNASRWLGVLSPFAALLMAVGFEKFRKNKLAWAALALFSAFCLFYNLNTNHFHKPLGGKYLSSDFRLPNLGYNQLDRYLTYLLKPTEPTFNTQAATSVWWYRDFKPNELPFRPHTPRGQVFNSLIVVDSQSIWFPTFWAVEKWKFYHGFAIMSTSEFLKVLTNEDGRAVLEQIGFKDAYYVKSGPEITRSSEYNYDGPDPVLNAILKAGSQPETVIRDDQGRDAFYIYKLNKLEI